MIWNKGSLSQQINGFPGKITKEETNRRLREAADQRRDDEQVGNNSQGQVFIYDRDGKVRKEIT